MKLCVLGSGSSGNAVLMQSGSTRILVDAGFGLRVMSKRLLSIGVDPRSIEAVIVTHEHTDHCKGAARGSERWGWQVHSTAGTLAAIEDIARARTTTFTAGTSFTIGDLRIDTVATSHDAEEPVAFIATGMQSGSRAAIVLDLGYVTERLQRALDQVDILVIESNHDGEMLRTGPYPASLKRRIASRHGHLSNRAAGSAAARAVHRDLSHVVLAHLSETNNTPGAAVQSMRSALSRTRFAGQVTASLQDRPSRTVAVSARAGFATVQLDLGL
jgi:phosphoribosyl 1,2-cyclic phosphodiesterase